MTENRDARYLRRVTELYPEGCTVRRRAHIPRGVACLKDTAVVLKVVRTGIHGAVYLKTGDWESDYLNPGSYEVVPPTA